MRQTYALQQCFGWNQAGAADARGRGTEELVLLHMACKYAIQLGQGVLRLADARVRKGK
jgi:hypothetical protein